MATRRAQSPKLFTSAQKIACHCALEPFTRARSPQKVPKGSKGQRAKFVFTSCLGVDADNLRKGFTKNTSHFTLCPGNIKAPKRSFRARLPPISEHVQKSRFCACHEIRARQRLPPKCCACHETYTSKQNRSDPWCLSRKADFEPPKHEVSLAPATKSDRRARKCARRHNESAVATSARRAPPDFVSLRSRGALRRFREA